MTVSSITGSNSTNPSATSQGALGGLASNYNEFLTLLTTQLQNQDPSSPVDTAQFTGELAQFAGVEQQISTNTNLTSLIQIAQSQQVLQGAAVLGKQADFNSTTLPLQNGAAHLDFTSVIAQPATVTVQQGANTVFQQTVTAGAGSNGWDWNGDNTAGLKLPDGPYTVSVAATAANGSSSNLAFTTQGTVTGVAQSGASTDLQLGATSLAISTLGKIVN